MPIYDFFEENNLNKIIMIENTRKITDIVSETTPFVIGRRDSEYSGASMVRTMVSETKIYATLSQERKISSRIL